ncbi:MAG TPA: alcohol dehydrogenase catalytic domain-containing protein [Chloroflexota bacterium]|nr:alcohol dehydrogenase catalytic domain-containing protein [Chloroflexota bacterium]
MQRALLTDVEQIAVESVSTPRPAQGEVRVEVAACGVCGSDLHMYRGEHPILRPPLVMGHEFVGRVVERGPGARTLAEGQRVVGIAGRGCGVCAACQAGAFNWCASLQIIGGHLAGGLAEHVVLPEEQFFPIPDSISDEQAALIEVAAVAVHSVARAGPVAGRACLVLGAGPVGLVLLKVLRALDAGPTLATDVSPLRRDLALACGAGQAWHPRDESHIVAAFPDGVDVAFDCAGREESVVQALRLTRRGGTVALTAIFPEYCTLPMTVIQRGERSLVGVQMYQRADFETVVDLIQAGRLDLGGIVTHRLPLAQVGEAFRLLSAAEPAVGKVLVLPRA